MVDYSQVRMVYKKSREEWYVFDGMKPIVEITEYTKGLLSENSKRGAIVALMLWYKFLDGLGLDFARAETGHIPRFRDWLKTKPDFRSAENIYVFMQDPHIVESTWNQYLSRIHNFYKKHIQVKYPSCKIEFTEECKWFNSSHPTPSEKLTFSERATKRDPRAYAIHVDDMVKILDKCNKRDRLIFEFMYVSGFRIGELFNIDVEQFRKHIPKKHPLFEVYIHDSVSADPNKQTKTNARTFDISIELAERIASYVGNERVVNACNEHDEIFTSMGYAKETKPGDPLSAKYIAKKFSEKAKEVGIKASIHDLRHSYVTNMASLGVNIIEIQEQVGHQSIETTNRYRSKSHSRVSREYLKAHEAINSKLGGAL